MLVTGTAGNGALSRGGLSGQVSTLEVGEVAATLLGATGLAVQVTHFGRLVPWPSVITTGS